LTVAIPVVAIITALLTFACTWGAMTARVDGLGDDIARLTASVDQLTGKLDARDDRIDELCERVAAIEAVLQIQQGGAG